MAGFRADRNIRRKLLKKLLLIIIIVATAEYLVMVFLERSGLSGNTKNLVDSLSLVIVLAPFFYLMYRGDRSLALSEARYRSLFENMLDGFAYCEMIFDGQGRPVDFIYLDVNSAFGKLTGLENVIGKKITEIIPGIRESNPELFEIYGRVALDGGRERFETYSEFFGGWLYVSVYRPERGYFVAVFDNITERKLAEKAVKIHVHQQAAVAELGQFALMEQDLSSLMEKSVAIVAECLGLEFSKVLELLPDGSGLLLKAGVGWKEGYVGHAIVGAESDSQAGYTLLANEPVVVEDLRKESRFRGPALLTEHGVVSGLSVVIPGKDRPYGVLGAHTSRHRTFNKDDISFVKSVANVVAEAVEHNKFESAIIERNERLIMLNRIDKAMTSSLDLQEVLEILMENITRAVKAEAGAFLLYDGESGVFSMQKRLNYGPQEGDACINLAALPHIMDVIKSKEPLVIGRADELSSIYRDYGIVSLMVLPVVSKGTVQGVTCLFNTKVAHEFTQAEVGFAMQVADQAMIAVMNARLVHNLKDREAALVRNNKELHALNSIAKIITEGATDLDIMLQNVLEKTLSLSFLEIQRKGVIFVRDEKDPDTLNMAAYAGIAPELVEMEKQIRLGYCLCGKAALTGEIIRSEDCFTDTDHTTGYPGMKNHGHVVTPIKSKDFVLGVMTFYLEPGTSASDHEERILAAIANQIAVAIENNRLFRHVSIAKKEWEETFDAMEELVTIHGRDYTILRANKATSRILGIDTKDIVGRKCYELFHEADCPLPICPAEGFLNGDLKSRSAVITIKGRQYELGVYPITHGGELAAYVHIMKDITERNKSERALKESEMKFRSLVEQSLVGVYIIQDDQFRYVNPRFAEIFGYTVEEITDTKGPRDLTLPDDWPLVQENIRKREAGEVEVLHYAFRGMRKQGDVVHVEVHGSRTFYEGRPAGIGVLMDITERLSAQDELVKNAQQMVVLREAARQLEEVNRLKSEFLANMSHELRTPLNAVIGLSNVLLQEKFGPINAKQSEYLGGINQSGEHLLSLINEILDLSKIEAGKEQLEPGTFDIEKTLRNTFIMVKEKAFKHNIELVSEIDPDIGTFYADERRVKQILFNLLSNAVKFTEPGGKVGMKALRNDAGLLITVWDTGIGISDNKKHLLFQPFQQLDSSLSRNHEGTGLGLVLTKKLVEMHGGSITFESKEGAGTSFTVMLPERHLPEPGAEAETSRPEVPAGMVLHASGRKIMVVEDNRLNMILASDYLKLNGFEVIEATDGEQALLKVSSERPDLILMDIQMPGVDGLEVTRRLKEDPSTRAIPIIAMTALAMQGDEKMCLSGGCDDYIRKPVNLDEMIAKIEKHFLAG